MAVSWYSLRDSFATRLDQLRVPTKEVQELLGHANVTTTLNSYIHDNEQTWRNVLDTLEDALLPKDGKLRIA